VAAAMEPAAVRQRAPRRPLARAVGGVDRRPGWPGGVRCDGTGQAPLAARGEDRGGAAGDEAARRGQAGLRSPRCRRDPRGSSKVHGGALRQGTGSAPSGGRLAAGHPSPGSSAGALREELVRPSPTAWGPLGVSPSAAVFHPAVGGRAGGIRVPARDPPVPRRALPPRSHRGAGLAAAAPRPRGRGEALGPGSGRFGGGAAALVGTEHALRHRGGSRQAQGVLPSVQGCLRQRQGAARQTAAPAKGKG